MIVLDREEFVALYHSYRNALLMGRLRSMKQKIKLLPVIKDEESQLLGLRKLILIPNLELQTNPAIL